MEFEFRHIPKTAGSSIEKALKNAGVNVGINAERSGRCQWHETARVNPNAQTWCVVREPLERFVSEHKWQSDTTRHGSMWNGFRECTVNALNDHVRQAYEMKLHQTSEGHCHYKPQSEYDCDIKLYFATINTDFPKFAHDMLGLENMTLDERVNDMTNKCKLTVDDLTEDSKSKLREIYAEDVKMYDKMRG